MPVLLVLVNFVVCYFIGVLGRNRKLGFWGHFFASLLLTPIIGMLLVVATDPVRNRNDPGAKPARGKAFDFARKKDVVSELNKDIGK